MIRLNRLPEFTEKALFMLRADESLKYRIISASGQTSGSSGKPAFRNLISLVCCFSAVALLLFFGLTEHFSRQANENIQIFTVASHTSVSPLSLQYLLSNRSSE